MLNNNLDAAFAAIYETHFHCNVSREYVVFQFIIYYHLSIIYIYTYYIKNDSFKHSRKRTFSKNLTYVRSALIALSAFKINAQSVDSSSLSLNLEFSSAFLKHMLIKHQSSTVTSSERKRKIKSCSEDA
jgi:hypothetical protein